MQLLVVTRYDSVDSLTLIEVFRCCVVRTVVVAIDAVFGCYFVAEIIIQVNCLKDLSS